MPYNPVSSPLHDQNIDVLQQALALAAQGLPVFPCKVEDKRPVIARWQLKATCDPEIIRRWWWDNRLIAVATGSASDLAVLDIDPRHGGDKFALANFDRLRTRTHATRSGGLHLLFRHQDGLRNSAALIAPGVDVRAEGGYVIWWPAHDCEVLNDGAIEPWPEWIVLPRPIARERDPNWGYHREELAARDQIRGLVDFVRDSHIGERNPRLFWAACRLAELDFLNSQDRQKAADHLLYAAMAVGLSEAEASRTIESGLTQELRDGQRR